MENDSEVLGLYSKQILALANDIPFENPIEAPFAAGHARSPICGSTVRVRVRMERGKIVAFSQKVRACSLGQAAAAIIGDVILGQGEANIQRGRDELQAMLIGGPNPTAPWERLVILRPAEQFVNRHPSILLVFDAILDALQHEQSAA